MSRSDIVRCRSTKRDGVAFLEPHLVEHLPEELLRRALRCFGERDSVLDGERVVSKRGENADADNLAEKVVNEQGRERASENWSHLLSNLRKPVPAMVRISPRVKGSLHYLSSVTFPRKRVGRDLTEDRKSVV